MNYVKDSIGWCDYTLNPIVGCLRRCWYCSSRIMFNRFKGRIWKLNNGDFENIAFYPRVLEDRKLKTIPPSKIFLGIMTDNEFWKIIVSFCKEYSQHQFMLLSKSIKGYELAFSRIEQPDNIWTGLTIGKYTYEEYYKVRGLCRKNSFLSIEPLEGSFNRSLESNIKLVIVGAMTQMGKSNTIPKQEWIDSIKRFVPSEKIYWKKNIRNYL